MYHFRSHRAVVFADGEPAQIHAVTQPDMLQQLKTNNIAFVKSSANCSATQQLWDVCPGYRSLKLAYKRSIVNEKCELEMDGNEPVLLHHLLPMHGKLRQYFDHDLKLEAEAQNQSLFGKKETDTIISFILSFLQHKETSFKPGQIRNAADKMGFFPYDLNKVIRHCDFGKLSGDEVEGLIDKASDLHEIMSRKGHITKADFDGLNFPPDGTYGSNPKPRDGEGLKQMHRLHAVILTHKDVHEQRKRYDETEKKKAEAKKQDAADRKAKLEASRNKAKEDLKVVQLRRQEADLKRKIEIDDLEHREKKRKIAHKHALVAKKREKDIEDIRLKQEAKVSKARAKEAKVRATEIKDIAKARVQAARISAKADTDLAAESARRLRLEKEALQISSSIKTLKADHLHELNFRHAVCISGGERYNKATTGDMSVVCVVCNVRLGMMKLHAENHSVLEPFVNTWDACCYCNANICGRCVTGIGSFLHRNRCKREHASQSQ